jgi:hypothetical protein
MPLLDDEEGTPAAAPAAAAAPKPPQLKRIAPPAGGSAAPARKEAPAAPVAPKTPKAPAYVEPPQSFPDEDELGTSEQERSPEMAVLLGERESRGPLAGSVTGGETADILARIGRVKELRSKYTPYAPPETQPWVRDARKKQVAGPYGGVESPTGFPVPSEGELASPTTFRDAGVRYAAAYRAAQQDVTKSLTDRDELVKKYMGGRTMNPSDPDYDAREVAEARKWAERQQALETIRKGKALQGLRDTLKQYGYSEDDIDKL